VGALKFEMCNAWDWEGFQFPSYGGVSMGIIRVKNEMWSYAIGV